jgi:hypothetical protein
MRIIEITPEIDEALGTSSVALAELLGSRRLNAAAEVAAYDAAIGVLASLVGSVDLAVEMTEAELV